MALSDSSFSLSLLSIKELEAKLVMFYRGLLQFEHEVFHLQAYNKRWDLSVEILDGYILVVSIEAKRKTHKYRCDLSEVEWAGEYELKHYKVSTGRKAKGRIK